MPALPSTPDPSVSATSSLEADAAATAAPATTSSAESGSDEPSVPPWISVFILLGALVALVAMFAAVCWVARSTIINRQRGDSDTQEAGGEDDEVVAQKMRQLDESAPATTYKAWKDEISGKSNGSDEASGGNADASGHDADGHDADGHDASGHERDDGSEDGAGSTSGAAKDVEIQRATVEAVAESNSFLVCVICLETLQDDNLIRNLSCGHIYHSDCIIKWYLKQHDTCPLCKTHYVPHEQDPLDQLGGGSGGSDGRHIHRRMLARQRQQAAFFRMYQTVSI